MKSLCFITLLLTALLASLSTHAQSTTWKTDGNTNLPASSYIGTNDATPVTFKVNGETQIKIAPDGSVRMASLTGSGPAYLMAGPSGELLRLTDPTVDSLFDCSVKLWKANGNYLTPDCFLGSTNPAAVRFLTHNTERMRITESGKVGIGTLAPKGILQIGDDMPLAVSVRTNGPSDTRYMLGFNTYLPASASTPSYADNGAAAMINWDATYEDLSIGVAPFGTGGQQALIPNTLVVDADGQVGVGTRPDALLHIKQAGGAAEVRIESGTPQDPAALGFWAGPFGPGTPTVQLASVKGAYNPNSGLGELQLHVNSGTNIHVTVPVMRMDKDQATLSTRLGIGTVPNASDRLSVDGAGRFTEPGVPGNHIRIRHDGTDAVIEHQTSTANSAAGNRLVINPGGNRTQFGGTVVMDANLGLGTDDFFDTGNGKDYRLSVDGRIRAREVKVYSSWADHVFEPGHELMPLSEVAAYIEAYGHLPGVPTAAEVEANGVEVGATQALLLEKIEELTLYLIKLEEENAGMKALVSSLSDRRE